MSLISMKVFPSRGQPSNKPDVTCQPFASRPGSAWVAEVLNVAGADFCLAARRRFEPGTILLVRAKGTGEVESTQVLARVLKVGEVEEGTWAMECRLGSEPDEGDLGVFRRAIRQASPSWS